MTQLGRVVAIIQARMGSERLPGKVLLDIAGRPMIDHVVDRARQIDGVSDVVVAIPDLAEDDRLADHLATAGVPVFRGPGTDVLTRYILAAEEVRAETVIRITADCPLLCPDVSSRVVAAFAAAETADYASNTLTRTFPRGLDTEVVSTEVLRRASDRAKDPTEREHVTAYVWRRPDAFALIGVQDAMDRSGMRLTVDTMQDLELVRAIWHAAGLGGLRDYGELLRTIAERPELLLMNATVTQKTTFGDH